MAEITTGSAEASAGPSSAHAEICAPGASHGRRLGVAAVVLAAVLVTTVWVLLSPDFGVTWDERVRHAYGVRVLRFWRGELTHADFLPTRSGGHLYAALFDSTAALLHEWAGGDVWLVRHRLNAVFGGVGLMATGLVALRLFGAWPAILAVTLLACSPRYVRDAMNNPKDIPFAALCAVSLLTFTLARPKFPFLSWGRALAVGLALALALNVRPGALLYLGFAWLLLLALTVRARAWSPRQLLQTVGRGALITVVTLVAGTALWPWAQPNPFVRPFQALLQASEFDWGGTMLFFGADVAASHPPAEYLPVWMGITIPPVVLVGMLLAAGATLRSSEGRLARLGLWAAALLPVGLVIVRGSTLYDGWRHMLFTYPPIVVLAATGWTALVRAAGSWRWELGAATVAVLGVGCFEPIIFMVGNHPHEVVYFNGFIGGPRGAFQQFELDYWGNSLAEATRWSASLARRAGIPLAVAGEPHEIVAANARRHPALYSPPLRANAHHLHVHLLRERKALLRATLARSDALYVVRMRDGTPLAIVFPGPRFADVAARVQPYLRSVE